MYSYIQISTWRQKRARLLLAEWRNSAEPRDPVCPPRSFSGFRVQGSGCRVEGIGFRIQG